jgi:UPF0271 protein
VDRSVDLNSDLGEGYGRWSFGTDEQILQIVSSANVACGAHAGDPTTIRATVVAAVATGTTIGAHVGYPDLQGFGRRFLDMPPAELVDSIVHQTAGLAGFARLAGTSVRYLKPHGALYNRAAVDDVHAAAVVRAVVEYDDQLAVLCQPGSRLDRLASEAGLRTLAEAFADRAYLRDGTLAPRSMPGAMVTDPQLVASRVVRLVLDQQVETIDGGTIELSADSICLHGDTLGAVALAAHVSAALAAAGIAVGSPFAAVE